ITDPHLVAPGVSLHGLDPYARLTACVDDIRANHADAAFCIITGDLAHKGEHAAYAGLKAQLQRLPMPCHALMGNHDMRSVYRSVFTDAPCDEDGFVQRVIVRSEGHFILLDTLSEGENGGRYCRRREAWLAQALQDAHDSPVYLFMHHPPFEVGIPS